MHAYGHQWACQLAYNPRLCHGLGLTDVERTWLRLRKLVGVVRTSSVHSFPSFQMLEFHKLSNSQRARRIWLTDQQLSSITLDLRDDLGNWIRCRLKKGVQEQGQKARQLLNMVNVPDKELWWQWDLQKAAQMSVRSCRCSLFPSLSLSLMLLADAPAWLKKVLDTILTPQGDLNAVEKAIHVAKITLS